MEDEARLAVLEAQVDFLSSALMVVAAGLKARGALGDAAWNKLYDTVEAVGRSGVDGAWERGRNLRALLGASG